jgi:glycosyltransferase involved in cell wall biosynthesis
LRTPFRLVTFTDSTVLGGAELALGTLLGSLGPHIDVTVMGVDEAVVSAVASERPRTPAVVVPEVDHKWNARSMWAQRRAISAARPDIFYAHLQIPWASRWPLLAASTVRGVRVVACERYIAPPASSGVREMKRFTSPRLAAHLAVSAAAARAVERDYGLTPGSIRVMPIGVRDVPLAALPRPAPGRVVGTLARADPVKGLDLLVRAAARLPDVCVVIVGPRRDERGDLERLADDLGVTKQVQFVDWTPSARDHLTTFDVFALPSRQEAAPNAVVEAMLARLPVVATRVGGIPEVVTAETGLLVPPDDVDALSDALRALVDDPHRRATMGEAGRRRALDRFTADRAARAYEDVFADVLSGTPASVGS